MGSAHAQDGCVTRDHPAVRGRFARQIAREREREFRGGGGCRGVCECAQLKADVFT